MYYVIPAVTAFLLTLICTLVALKWFPKWGLVDKPEKYNLKRKPIPYFGGLIIFGVFLICSLSFYTVDKHLIGLLIGAGLLTLMNFFDDKYGLPPLFRLFMQLLSALILILAGIGITHITNPFGGDLWLNDYEIPMTIDGIEYQFTLFADLFTIIWVLGMTNTMNWLDGLNGLPSGITTISCFTLFFLSISDRVNQPEIAVLSIILGSICLAFWIFDFYPAKILMGDTGSMFLGFTLATFAIFSGGKVATAFMVMGFPILDSAWVILRRIKNKQSPFRGDQKHFHHRLLEVGLTDRQALFFIYILCGLFGISALFLDTLGKLIAIILMFILMFITGSFLVKKGKRAKQISETKVS